MTGGVPVPGRDSRAYCGGKKRQGTGNCTRPAGWGTEHPGTGSCKLHGGSTPNGRLAAATERARLEVAALDVEPVGDPLHQLAILAAQILAWRDSMAEQVNNLTSLRYEAFGENSSGEQLRAEVSLWERALDRCERVLTAMARLNIDERLAKISERQAELIESALKATLSEMGLDLDEQDRAARSVARHLRAA